MSNETALRDAPVQAALSCSKSEEVGNLIFTSILFDPLNVGGSSQFVSFFNVTTLYLQRYGQAKRM